MLSWSYKKYVHFFSILKINPIGKYNIIENQLLKKLPDGIKGNKFMNKEK